MLASRVISRLSLKFTPNLFSQNIIAYSYGDDLLNPPKFQFPHFNRQQRKYIYKKQVPKFRADLSDTLYLHTRNIQQFYSQFVNTKEQIPISSQNVGMLLYNFSKNDLLLPEVYAKIQPYVSRFRGEYQMRTIFGCLYAAIRSGKKELFEFFLNQLASSEHKFSGNECFELIIALNHNKQMTIQQKHNFWNQYCRQRFIEKFLLSKQKSIKKALFYFDVFYQFQYYDQVIWDRIISLLENKHSWLRVTIIEKLYPITGIFPRAKQLFDRYFMALSHSVDVNWRYNLEELRYYTSQQMIAKSQQNIQMKPQFQTFLHPKQAQYVNNRFAEYQKTGHIVIEKEVIKDKSQSFAYAIHDRFERLKEDNIDMSQLSQEQLKDLFGEYDQQLMKQAPKQQGADQNQQAEQFKWKKAPKEYYDYRTTDVDRKIERQKRKIYNAKKKATLGQTESSNAQQQNQQQPEQ